jgi:hypothetical protein
MKSASVKQFVALRAALLNEKAQLEARLKEICAGLEMTAPTSAATAPAKVAVLGRPPKKKRAARVENTMSLYEAVTKAVAAKPLTKEEILKAIDGLGYKFSASNPMMSLNTLVYTPGKLKKHPGGKWGPVKK